MKNQIIKEVCLKQKSKNPIEIAQIVMNQPEINMHGPEHHVLDGATFLTALKNAGVDFDLEKALDEMIERGKLMPGATCGKWGVCGSASSLGASLSILHGTGPLTNDIYYKDHMELTSRILNRMSEIGGPRCCKRNAFVSISTSVEFVKEKYGIDLESSEIRCHYFPRNKQCIQERCPFYKNMVK